VLTVKLRLCSVFFYFFAYFSFSAMGLNRSAVANVMTMAHRLSVDHV